MDPPPILSKVYSMVLQHERQLNPSIQPIPKTTTITPTLLAVKANITPSLYGSSQGKG